MVLVIVCLTKTSFEKLKTS